MHRQRAEHILRAEVDANGNIPVNAIVHTSPAGSFAYDFDISESINAGGALPKCLISLNEFPSQNNSAKRLLLCNSVSVLEDSSPDPSDALEQLLWRMGHHLDRRALRR